MTTYGPGGGGCCFCCCCSDLNNVVDNSGIGYMVLSQSSLARSLIPKLWKDGFSDWLYWVIIAFSDVCSVDRKV
jgi:hypothetical protein